MLAACYLNFLLGFLPPTPIPPSGLENQNFLKTTNLHLLPKAVGVFLSARVKVSTNSLELLPLQTPAHTHRPAGIQRA